MRWPSCSRTGSPPRRRHPGAAGYDAALALLSGPEPPTAIARLNDVIALGACSAALSLGLELGRDVSIIGFDDIPMAQWYPFSLTTVRCDEQQSAGTAVALLLDRIEAPGRAARRLVIPAPLVLRSTHGPSSAELSEIWAVNTPESLPRKYAVPYAGTKIASSGLPDFSVHRSMRRPR